MSIYTTSDSLHWTLDHINRHGDTDIFPVPFEYGLYNNVKPQLIDELAKIDIERHQISGINKMFSPKHTGGYRPIAQLNPIDCMLMTSLIAEEAEKYENGRIPISEGKACAYRISKNANGDMFDFTHGWVDFQEKSKEYLTKHPTTHVVIVDIADFYNQVSHHRIENSITSCGISRERAKEIERLLGQINGVHHSRGLPIGPMFSIILAESCLNDVDQYLLRKGYLATRYVDDFRIFCQDEDAAQLALYELTDYLHVAHRLALQGSKTKIIASSIFNNELIELEDIEEEKR